jgi:hypothetical protein
MACHIAAAAGGQNARRYDPKMSEEERASIQNGIWMCYTHGKLIDTDESRFTIPMLKKWRELAELRARLELDLGHDVDLSPTDVSDHTLVENSISFSGAGIENELIGNAVLDSCLPVLWGDELADATRDLLIELLRNAFQHGGAKKVQIQLEPKSIRFIEDGSEFDPWDLLTREQGGGGSAAVKRIVSGFGDLILTTFKRTANQNEIVLALARFVDDIKDFTQCVAHVELRIGHTPRTDVKLSVLESCKTVYVVLPDYLSYSDIAMIADSLRPLASDGGKRTIVFIVSLVSSAVRELILQYIPGSRIIGAKGRGFDSGESVKPRSIREP